MREDQDRREPADANLVDLGAASELTKGIFMPLATESVFIKDFFDE